MGAFYKLKTPEQNTRPTESRSLGGVTQSKPEDHCHRHLTTKTPLSPTEEGAFPTQLWKAEETHLIGRG